MSSVEVKQFRTPSAARLEAFLSYCLVDSATREALLVDPHFETLSEYTEFLNSNRLKLVWIVETQSHFSHPTATRALLGQYQAAVAMSEATSSFLATRKLHQDEKLKLGNTEILILLTPGNRPDSLCLSVQGMVFTGETLWAGVSAGFGLPESDCTRLFESLQFLKKTVKDRDLVFPGYDVQGLLFSRWKTELERNPDLLSRNAGDLKELKKLTPVRLSEDGLSFANFNSKKDPKEFHLRKSENFFHTENTSYDRPRYSTISPDKLSHKLGITSDALAHTLIDVRDPEEFAHSHIPGSKNISSSNLNLVPQIAELEKLSRIYLFCQTGKRSTLAANTLSYIGIKDVVVLNGGIQAWQSAGLPTEK